MWVNYIYRGGGRSVIPRYATHVTIHESITVIPAQLFYDHPDLVELICHAGVIRIERRACAWCKSLERVIIPGVEIIEDSAFYYCKAVTYVECRKLERIEGAAFCNCRSLRSINLSSVKEVLIGAFCGCQAMTEAKFGAELETLKGEVFCACTSLERITIPLKMKLINNDLTVDIFQACENLKCVELVEAEALHKTIDALHMEGWRDEMNQIIDHINQFFPTVDASREYSDDKGGKGRAIQLWIKYLLQSLLDYKVKHRRILNETASILKRALPDDAVMNKVLPFLELPPHKLEGETEGSCSNDSEDSHCRSDGDDNELECEEDDDDGDVVSCRRVLNFEDVEEEEGSSYDSEERCDEEEETSTRGRKRTRTADNDDE